jgi:O-methyltransferase
VCYGARMQDITFSALTWAQLLNMADGLVAGGNYALAQQLYARGARVAADPLYRRRFRARLGIVSPATQFSQMQVRISRELEAVSASVFVGEGLATWNKSTPFLDDDRFFEVAARHAHLLPLANWHWNLQTALWAVQEASRVEGDFVELGVFRGHTTLFCADYLEFQTWPRRWWLYDTFEGIPQDQLDPGWDRINRETYEGQFSYEEVVERFAGFPNIDVIRGRVPEILVERSPDRIAFLHVDLNNATAEIAALDLLFDRVPPGGVVLFDDYGWANASAQHEAEARWFAVRGLRILPLATGQGIFVKR